jgi:hypothetical protein
MRDDLVVRDAWDFGDIVALLKLWGIPFDVMRLDIHRMTLGDFLDFGGKPKYGTIVWTARGRNEHPWSPQDYRVVAEAVGRLHIGFIAVGNKIQDKIIQDILGLTYEDFKAFSRPVKCGPLPHFVTRGLEKLTAPAEEVFDEGGALVRVAAADVTVLAASESEPQLTARTIDAGSRTRAVWIGGDPDIVFRSSPLFIQFLRRAIIWVQGYGLYKEYDATVVLRMDDPGSAQSSYLTGWDYPQLDESAIKNGILAPLREHGARLGIGFCPGFPWIPSRSLRHSISVDFVDPRGTRQNIVSSSVGLRQGLLEGLLDIESHGLTHMLPDLDTPPKGGTRWWTGSLASEWPDDRWYREFFDMRRDTEIGAAVQLSRLRQSADWIEQDFGRRPLVFIPGGHEISGDWFVEGEVKPNPASGKPKTIYVPPHIAETYTYKLAAEAGYGLALDQTAHYLGRDFVISLGMCTANEIEDNFARRTPAVVYFHDRDLRLDPGYLANLLDRLSREPGITYMGLEEWAGYLHAGLSAAAPSGDSLSLILTIDQNYGRYFADHPSVWTLHLSDEVRADLRRLGEIEVAIDGARQKAEASAFFPERRILTFPRGLGPHSITIFKAR